MSKSRSLTPSEISLAKSIFSNSIDYTLVKIYDGKYMPFQPYASGMTPNGRIYVNGIYKKDYGITKDEIKAFFIHEMVHVYQYQLKILNLIGSAIGSSLKNGFNYTQSYQYRLDANKDLLDYGIEQQAQIIEDYYRVCFVDLDPFKNYMQNDLVEVKRENLFEKVLKKFIENPSYAKHDFVCRRKLMGKSRKLSCSRVLVK
ncbi:hypothetical protein [Sessilibacter corallicola]|uniref:Type IV secretion protein Rhs n=1 Tax=Sessilibacter corallicola TaxID=2904075 RepID=A0ABQ0A597_9GAMM